MTRDDIKELLITINTLYPNWKPDDLTGTIDTWHEQLKDVELSEAKIALRNHIESDKGSFIPNISVFVPKRKEVYGFKGRVYSHEFYKQLEEENKGW